MTSTYPRYCTPLLANSGAAASQAIHEASQLVARPVLSVSIRKGSEAHLPGKKYFKKWAAACVMAVTEDRQDLDYSILEESLQEVYNKDLVTFESSAKNNRSFLLERRTDLEQKKISKGEKGFYFLKKVWQIE